MEPVGGPDSGACPPRLPRSSGPAKPTPSATGAVATLHQRRPGLLRRALTCPNVLPMCLPQFLFDRMREELDEATCEYEIDPQGRITCLCENPSEDIRAALSRWDLVRWCERQPGAEPVLAMLADLYAHHPDHRLEWHNLQ